MKKQIPLYLFVLLAFAGLLIENRSLSNQLKEQRYALNRLAQYTFNKHSQELVVGAIDTAYQNIQQTPELAGLEFDWLRKSTGGGNGMHHLGYELTFNRTLNAKEVELLFASKNPTRGYTPDSFPQLEPFAVLQQGTSYQLGETLETSLSQTDPRKVTVSYHAVSDY